MSEVSSFESYMESEHTVTDYTNNGKCSNCGNCCSDLIPLSNADINRIKKYIKKHNIKPVIKCIPLMNTFDVTCPFRDDVNKKCTIYEVRPQICREFTCHRYKENLYKMVRTRNRFIAENFSMRATFFSD